MKGALLHSGAYDLDRLYQETTSFWLRLLLNPQNEKQPRFQNLLARVNERRLSTLVLQENGIRSCLSPRPSSCATAWRAWGKHQLIAFPEHGHRLRIRDIQDHATGGSACPVSDP